MLILLTLNFKMIRTKLGQWLLCLLLMETVGLLKDGCVIQVKHRKIRVLFVEQGISGLVVE